MSLSNYTNWSTDFPWGMRLAGLTNYSNRSRTRGRDARGRRGPRLHDQRDEVVRPIGHLRRELDRARPDATAERDLHGLRREERVCVVGDVRPVRLPYRHDA